MISNFEGRRSSVKGGNEDTQLELGSSRYLLLKI